MANDREILTQILVELQAIRQALEPRHIPEVLNGHHGTLSRLLPAIAGKFGSEGFIARELLNDAVFAELLGGMNAHQVGNLLARSVNQNIDGLRVERLTTEHRRAVWHIVRVW